MRKNKQHVERAFKSWVSDIDDLYPENHPGFQRRDPQLPTVALLGVYISVVPEPNPTVYEFTKSVAGSSFTLDALARVLQAGDTHLSSRFQEQDQLEIPIYTGSNIYAHLDRAVHHGRPETDMTISSSELVLSEIIGRASYDYLVKFDPLRVDPAQICLFSDYPSSLELMERELMHENTRH